MTFLAKTNQSSFEQLCHQYLDILYRNVHGYQLSNRNKGAPITESYGEILSPSAAKLFNYLQLTENDVFIDLGSGVGKMTAQVFLQTKVRKAVGIELLPQLHAPASAVAKQIQTELPELFAYGRQLEFILGDFLQTSFVDATVLLLCSVCFTQPLLNQLGEIINALPKVHTVLSLRPLNNLTRLRFIKAIRVECSWDTALCYVYQK